MCSAITLGCPKMNFILSERMTPNFGIASQICSNFQIFLKEKIWRRFIELRAAKMKPACWVQTLRISVKKHYVKKEIDIRKKSKEIFNSGNSSDGFGKDSFGWRSRGNMRWERLGAAVGPTQPLIQYKSATPNIFLSKRKIFLEII